MTQNPNWPAIESEIADRVREAVAAERERCARLVEQTPPDFMGISDNPPVVAASIRRAIKEAFGNIARRIRGET